MTFFCLPGEASGVPCLPITLLWDQGRSRGPREGARHLGVPSFWRGFPLRVPPPGPTSLFSEAQVLGSLAPSLPGLLPNTEGPVSLSHPVSTALPEMQSLAPID